MKSSEKKLNRVLLLLPLAASLVACGGGGGGGGGTATGTGYFKDSATQGLAYQSGSITGVTDSSGRFTYEKGQMVTFSVGGVALGSASGGPVVTPVDLVSGGTTSTPKVQNIVRFLMMLDDDGNPDNGITISSAVQTAAQNWTQVDFSAADLGTELTTIISDVASVDNRTPTLADAATAQTHLGSTLRCAYSGAFMGSYSGDDYGSFGVLVDAATGDVTGIAYSTPGDSVAVISGGTPVSLDQSATFVAGNISSGATFDGSFSSADQMSGTWNNTVYQESGTFSGSRIGGSSSAAYRFTGEFSGTDYGLFAFDVDSSNHVTGVAYNVALDDLINLSGTVSGTSLSVTASDGSTIAGTLNTTSGALSGEWIGPSGSGASGTYLGSGCKLN